jgi:Fibronectin type III domain
MAMFIQPGRSTVLTVAAILSALAAIQAAPSAVAAESGARIYVSPAGNDSNPGTAQRPILTLLHSRDLVRKINANMTGDITIILDGGTYRLAQPLILDTADSGSNGHDIVWISAQGRVAIISGAVRVTGWKRVDPSRNLWTAPAPPGLENTLQIYVDGVRAFRARGPLPVTLTQTRTGFIASSDALAHWRNPSDIEFVYTGGNAIWTQRSEGLGAWTEPRCPVAGIDGKIITMAEPCWSNSTRRVDLPPNLHFKRTANLVGPASIGNAPVYVENAYELLGTPGQFYFDRPAGMLYYVPRAGEDLATADVEAPRLEKLIDAAGTADHPIHNLIFRGLQFSYATWLFPCGKQGFSEIQANYMVTGERGYAIQGLDDLVPGGLSPFGAWTPTPANVALVCDRNIQFVRDNFVHLGAAGLALGDGSQSDLVRGCVFTDISGNGLDLGNVDLPEANDSMVTRDNTIEDNHLYDLPAEFHGGVAICVGYAQRTRIAHNQIDHLPYSAISMGWGGWPDKIKRPGLANNSQNNVVADNLIFDHMQLLADGGAIYTQGLTGPSLAMGEKVTGNVIHDQFSSGHGIYSDNGSCNMTISGNVIFRTNFDNWGSTHGDYYNGQDGKDHDPITVENNYWQQGNPDSSSHHLTMKGNRLINSLGQIPPRIIDNAGIEKPLRDILNASFAAHAAPQPPQRVAAAVQDAGSALITWSPPILRGSSPVQSYTVQSSAGQSTTISAQEFAAKGYAAISGLKPHTYTFTVMATNADGTSPRSMPSEEIRVGERTIHPPSKPKIHVVSAGDGMVSVHFSAPEDDGGSPVTAYTFTAQLGGRKVTMTGRTVLVLAGKHSTFFVVDGLQNGTTYTIDVAAVNAAGEGPAARSREITPVGQ